jgi:DNA-directed RNA polymerase sigma subunit (sigma70/sigma32)
MAREWEQFYSEAGNWHEKLVAKLKSRFPKISMDLREDAIKDAMEYLSPKQRYVLKRRFTIEEPFETLQAIANRYGVTRERIRHAEWKALQCLCDKLRVRDEAAVRSLRN